MTQTIEDSVLKEFKAGKASLERTLLGISGLRTEEEIAEYTAKIDYIENQFKEWYSSAENAKTPMQALFDYLWSTKTDRYNKNFLLTDIIDNQLNENPEQKVGDCVGLTSLYTVLGQRLGLDLAVLRNPEHILSLLTDDDENIIVENTNHEGFDYNIDLSHYQEEDPNALVAIVLGKIGNFNYTSTRYEDAIIYYNKALELEPESFNSLLTRGCAKSVLGKYEEAIEDFNKIIELSKNYIGVDDYKQLAEQHKQNAEKNLYRK